MLHRIVLFGTLPAALLATLVGATPQAHADDSDNCEQTRQEYCYGEGNAFLDCYDESNPDRRAACFKSTVYLCETVLTKVCDEQPGTGGGGGTAGSVSYNTECPPGTMPDPLGRCVAKLRQRTDGPDLDPNDWCEPGFVPGPTDECVPAIHTVRLVPSDSGGWGLICPSGSKPGPAGGCVLDSGIGGGGPVEGCGPGSGPGPDDGCVPRWMSMAMGNVDGMLAMDALTQSGVLAELPQQSQPMLEQVRVAIVGDPVEGLASTAEAFGAELIDPDEPGAW